MALLDLSSRNFGNVSECGKTNHSVDGHNFIWTINNFRDYFINDRSTKESSLFSIGTNDIHVFSLFIESSAFDSGTSNFVIHPCLLPKEPHSSTKFMVELSILDKDNVKRSTRILYFPSTHKQSEFRKSARKLFDKPDQMLPNGELRIACKICNLSSITDEIVEVEPPQNALLEGFSKLLNNQKFSDFKLAVKGKEFPVHRAVLAARSPVFEAMFDSNMRETNEGKAHIENVDPTVMEKLLHFVYTGEIRVEDLDEQMLAAADMYQFDSLKLQCENELVKKLSVDNVYDILQIADQNNALVLKKKTIQFFDKKVKILVTSKDFKSSIDALPGHLKTDIIHICALNR